MPASSRSKAGLMRAYSKSVYAVTVTKHRAIGFAIRQSKDHGSQTINKTHKEHDRKFTHLLQ